jgi:hypothetical protein
MKPANYNRLLPARIFIPQLPAITWFLTFILQLENARAMKKKNLSNHICVHAYPL